MSAEARNKAIVLEAFDTLFNKRDYDAAERFWSPSYVQHSAHIEPGRDGLFNLIRGIPPTLKYEHEQIVAEGELVMVHGRFSASGPQRLGCCRYRPRGRWSSRRALGRDRGRSVGGGVQERPAHVRRSLSRAIAVFVLPPPEFDPEPGYPEVRAVIHSIAEALKVASPRRVLYLSTVGADAQQDNLLSQRTLLEQALGQLPIPLTVLRPAWYLDNAAWDVNSARDTGIIHSFLQPTDKRLAMVAARDVGQVAAELIQQDWTGTRVMELEGPTRVSPDDLATTFTRALGHTVRAMPVPRESWAALFRSQGMRNPEPRMRMLDGFNEGWIDLSDGGKRAIKGSTSSAEVCGW
jgi:uncharacterized protein YbjT (DUF2867 family)/predicted SnoaL-like aldol condensation-catalyzing enzyme